MSQVHYELFVRRKVGAQWTLEIASENRAHALQTAEDVLEQGRAVAVRVSKETLNRMLQVKKEVMHLRQRVAPQRDVRSRGAPGAFQVVRARMVPYDRDV